MVMKEGAKENARNSGTQPTSEEERNHGIRGKVGREEERRQKAVKLVWESEGCLG
jgi:hypothetical protein